MIKYSLGLYYNQKLFFIPIWANLVSFFFIVGLTFFVAKQIQQLGEIININTFETNVSLSKVDEAETPNEKYFEFGIGMQ